MIELTEKQSQELEGPEPARVLDPQANNRYVLVREELYERMQTFLNDEGTIQLGKLVDQTMKEYDEADPLLASYAPRR